MTFLPRPATGTQLAFRPQEAACEVSQSLSAGRENSPAIVMSSLSNRSPPNTTQRHQRNAARIDVDDPLEAGASGVHEPAECQSHQPGLLSLVSLSFSLYVPFFLSLCLSVAQGVGALRTLIDGPRHETNDNSVLCVPTMAA